MPIFQPILENGFVFKQKKISETFFNRSFQIQKQSHISMAVGEERKFI